MAGKALDILIDVVTFSWLTGPIFSKELRVSARRRRNYLLRTLYVAGLLTFVIMVWLAVVPAARYSGARRLMMMPEAGKWVVATVVIFQCCAVALLAIVLPSTAISDEVYHRTLGVLLTTPITAWQIVAGKMLAKLSQILLLLAISVPVLALVRVFGGVPWEFVVAGVCLTVAVAVFCASVSLFFSIFNRHAYLVILETIFALGILFILLPLGVGWLLDEATRMSERTILHVIGFGNPIVCLVNLVINLERPGRYTVPWVACTGVLLAAAGGVLLLCVALVRRVALRQMIGSGRADEDAPPLPPAMAPPLGMPPMIAPAAGGAAVPPPLVSTVEPPLPLPPPPLRRRRTGRRIRRVVGQPLMWRELRRPVLRRRLWRILVPVGMLVILLITYGILIEETDLDNDDVQTCYVVVFVILGLLTTLILGATSITSEKESRCWPLLMMTTMSSGSIALAKAAGVARRSLPIWTLLIAHVAVFTLVGYIHPIVSLHLAMLVTYSVIFLTGTGMFLSSVFRRTTTAVVMNLGLAIMLWLVGPLLAELTAEIHHPFRRTTTYNAVMRGNPVVQAVACTVDASGRSDARRSARELRYRNWPRGRTTLAETTSIVLASLVVYSLAGAFFAWLAAARFRHKVF